MSTQTDVQAWIGRDAVDPRGDKVGKIDDVYLDRASGEPEWLTIKTGLFGSRTSFVPLRGATLSGEDVSISYTKSQIKDPPNIDADGELSDDEERRLYNHYGHDWGDYDPSREYESDRFARATDDTTVGHDTSGPETDEAMTRSEEELHVDTRRREAGRARLRKYVVTEEQDGPEISEEEHEVVLHEEVPVVEKQAVPKERVRLDTETQTHDVEVAEQVRKERIDAEGDDVAR